MREFYIDPDGFVRWREKPNRRVMIKWNWKRVIGMIVSMAAYALLIGLLTGEPHDRETDKYCHDKILTLLVVSAGITLLCIFIAWRPLRKAVTVTVIAAMLLGGLEVRADEPKNEPFIGQCILAAVVIGIGIFIICKLKKVCDRCLPPTKDPNQPPNAQTNNPPHLSFVSDGKIALELTDSAVDIYDVSGYTFTNTAPDGSPYTRWYCAALQSSTNLQSWTTERTVDGWISQTYNTTLWRDGNGAVVYTNTSPNGVQAEIPTEITGTEEKKFFRLIDAD